MIDLHTHSTSSDGQYSPEVLVQMAKDAHLRAFSVSDHDTIEWSTRAVQRGREIGIQVISAVEISASFRWKALHILGYDFDHTNPELITTLHDISIYRRDRIKTMVRNMNHELWVEGMNPIDVDSILKLGIEKPITRVDLAEYLLAHGYIKTLQEAFDRWLNRLNIPNRDFSVIQAIQMIHNAGGVAVLAHPWAQSVSLQAITSDFDEQVRIIMDFRSAWLDGIEVYRFNQSKKMEQIYIGVAKDLGLIATGWSDFHGPKIIGSAPGIGNNLAPENTVNRIVELGAERKPARKSTLLT